MIRRLHGTVVMLQAWTPGDVWAMTLEDAACAARAGMRRMLLAAQLQAACIAAPLLGAEGQRMMQELSELLSDEEPARELSVEDRYGAQFAADYEGVQRRLREWLQSRPT